MKTAAVADVLPVDCVFRFSFCAMLASLCGASGLYLPCRELSDAHTLCVCVCVYARARVSVCVCAGE